MTTGLFGQSIADPIPGDTLPLFHEPVAALPVTLPGTTAEDRKIAAKFDAKDTPPIDFEARKLRRREPIARQVEAELRRLGIPFVSVDDAKKALFTNAKLATFHFTVYSERGDNWLLMCREPNHELRTDMEQWESVFGDGYKAVFAVRRGPAGRQELVYQTLAGERLKLGDD